MREVDRRWCLIHATHMTDAETDGLRERRGRRPVPDHRSQSRRRHVCRAPLSRRRRPLRHRLRFQRADRRRRRIAPARIFAAPGAPRAQRARQGQRLDRAAGCSTRLAGGAQALGAGPAGIAPGNAADLVSLDAGHPTLAGKHGDAILDAWIFANGGNGRLRLGARAKARRGGGRRDAVATNADRTAFRAVMAETGRGLRAMDAQPVSLAPAHPRRHQRADRFGRLAARPPHPVRARAVGRIPVLAHDREQGAVAACQERADRAAPALRQLRHAAALASGDPRNPRHQGGGAGARPALPLRAERRARRAARTAADRQRLDVAAGSSVVELSCRHFAGEQPFCLEERLISLAAVPEAADESFRRDRARAMAARPRAVERGRAHDPRDFGRTPRPRPRSTSPQGSPCLVVERRTWSADQPVTLVTLTYAGDSHALVARFAPS